MTSPTTATAAAAAAGTGPAGHAGTAPVNPSGVLGQNDFLKLMIAQLQAQNPMQPASDSEFLGQMASMTEMEQMTNLANAGELSGAVQLIGHQVTYNGAGGAAHTGKVESVQTTSSGTALTIGGVTGIPESSVTEIV